MSLQDYLNENHELTFKQLFDGLTTIIPPHVELRLKIVEATGMAETTFWYKLKNDKFKQEEKQKIAELLNQSVNTLFPC